MMPILSHRQGRMIIDRVLDRLSSLFYWLFLRITRSQHARLGSGGEAFCFEKGEASDSSYKTVRDYHNAAVAKGRIEHFWMLYAPFADRQCRNDAKAHFHQRTWEIYLGAIPRMHGFELHKIGDEGPEFYVEIGGMKVWLEAIAPGPGELDKADSVPPLQFGRLIAQDVPEEKIILRFTQALKEKLTKYETARRKGIISAKDGYIVAINGWAATNFRGEEFLPHIIKAVLAVGPLTVMFSQKRVESFYQRRLDVKKENLSSVPTKAFLSPEYVGISGLLYSSTDIVNVREPFGSEIFFLHNPLAKNPIPAGTFRFQCEYRYSLETEQLNHCDWRKAPC